MKVRFIGAYQLGDDSLKHHFYLMNLCCRRVAGISVILGKEQLVLYFCHRRQGEWKQVVRSAGSGGGVR
jgi:hypothetical protein